MKLRRLVLPLAVVVVAWLLLPPAAFADNCGSLTDCYNTLRAALAAAVGVGLFAALLSLGLDFIPGVGTAKGIVEAVTGRDMITGEELAWWERVLGIVPVAGAVIGGAAGLMKVGRHLDDVGDMARATDKAADAADAGGDVSRAADTADDAAGAGRAADAADDIPTRSLDDLPPEAKDTLDNIEAGGPFPYKKDGTIFENRKNPLPQKPEGYYQEYTVETPGATNRAKRRIVTGKNGEVYYTDDHYLTFVRVK